MLAKAQHHVDIGPFTPTVPEKHVSLDLLNSFYLVKLKVKHCLTKNKT